ILAVLLAFGAAWPRYRAEWIWPDPRRVSAYRGAGGALAVLLVAVGSGVSEIGARGDGLLLVGVVPAAFGLIYLIVCGGTEAVWRPLAWVAAVGGSLAIAGGLVGRVPPSLLAVLAIALVVVVRAGLRAEDAKASDAQVVGADRRYVWLLAFLLLAVAAF